jgi:phosphoribosyl 1,2-cyclic phosphodiesterase
MLHPMRVKILGTRGNIPLSSPYYSRRSGVLIDGHILLDLGEASYVRNRPQCIFITHLHPDHAAFLHTEVATDAAVYTPERTPKWPPARVASRPLCIGAYRIVPVPTRHSAKVRSLGYVVQRRARRLFFSSDMLAIDPRYNPLLTRLDLVITDGSYMRRGGLVRVDRKTGKRFGHLGIPDLVAFFRQFSSRILITHFGSWFYKDIRSARRKISALGDGVRVSAARDGMVLTV